MSTVPEHVQRLSLIRKLWVREFGRQPTDQELMLDLAFKEEATRLCAVHLSELEAAHVSGVRADLPQPINTAPKAGRFLGWDAHGPEVWRARPLSEWHEDDGPVTWWALPVQEPAWIGQPTDSDWPGYHTHWTPHPPVPADGGS